MLKQSTIKLKIRKAGELIELARYQDAEKILRQVLKVDPLQVEAYYNMGEVLTKLEKFT